MWNVKLTSTNRVLGERQRTGAELRQLPGELERLLEDGPGGIDLGDQAAGAGLVAAEVGAQQDELHGLVLADDVGQPLRAAGAGDQPDLDLGQAKVGFCRGRDDVALQRHD